MNIIVPNMPLSLVGSVDVGFGVFVEIAPADAADVGVFTTPNGGSNIINALVL